jgi:type IV pilus assembly protein PilV
MLYSIHQPRKSQKGMLLIEVLVAMLLFVVGVLGLVKAMAVSQSAQTDAQFRADAAKHASYIVQQIWLTAPRDNSTTFSLGLADFQHQATTDSPCAFSGTASTNALVTDWVTAVQTGNERLPGATAAMQQVIVNTAAGGNNQVTVNLCWKGPNDTAPRRHTYSAYVNENF